MLRQKKGIEKQWEKKNEKETGTEKCKTPYLCQRKIKYMWIASNKSL